MEKLLFGLYEFDTMLVRFSPISSYQSPVTGFRENPETVTCFQEFAVIVLYFLATGDWQPATAT
jgi:hypothetical protein